MATRELVKFAARNEEGRKPKRLRLRLFSVAGKLATTARSVTLHLSSHAPWARLLTDAVTALRELPAPT
jgi:hypothetical protein